jgi:hypothetical protein
MRKCVTLADGDVGLFVGPGVPNVPIRSDLAAKP